MVNAKILDTLPYRRMLYLRGALYLFPGRISDPVFKIKKRREKPAIDVTIFIDCCAENCTAIFFIPYRIVCSPAKE
jgi:hypothetical protein